MTAPSIEHPGCTECSRLKSVNCTLRLNLQKMNVKMVETNKLVNLFKKQKAQQSKTREELDRVKLENQNLTDQLRFHLEKHRAATKSTTEKTVAEYIEESKENTLRIAELENMNKQLKLKLSLHTETPINKATYDKLVSEHEKLVTEHSTCKSKIMAIRETEHRLRSALGKVASLEKKLASAQLNLSKSSEKFSTLKLQHKVEIHKLRQSLKDSKTELQTLKFKTKGSTRNTVEKPPPAELEKPDLSSPRPSLQAATPRCITNSSSLETAKRSLHPTMKKEATEVKKPKVLEDQSLSSKPLSPASEEMVKTLKKVRSLDPPRNITKVQRKPVLEKVGSEPLRPSLVQPSASTSRAPRAQQPSSSVSTRKRKREAAPRSRKVEEDLNAVKLGLCSESSLLVDLKIGELTLRDFGVEDTSVTEGSNKGNKRLKEKENLSLVASSCEKLEEPLVESLFRLKNDKSLLPHLIEQASSGKYEIETLVSATMDVSLRICQNSRNTCRQYGYFPQYEQILSCLLTAATPKSTAHMASDKGDRLLRSLCNALISHIQNSGYAPVFRCSSAAMISRIMTAVARSLDSLMTMRMFCVDILIAGIRDPMIFCCMTAVWPDVFSVSQPQTLPGANLQLFHNPCDTLTYALALVVSLNQKEKSCYWTPTTSKERAWFRTKCHLRGLTKEAESLDRLGCLLAERLLSSGLKSPNFLEASTLRLIFAQQGYQKSYQCVVKYVWPLIKQWRMSPSVKIDPSVAEEIISFAVTLIGDAYRLGNAASPIEEEAEQHRVTLKFLVTSLEKLLNHSVSGSLITLPIAHTLVHVLLSMGATDSDGAVALWCKRLSDVEKRALPANLKSKIATMLSSDDLSTTVKKV